jgi:hypothetical protein
MTGKASCATVYELILDVLDLEMLRHAKTHTGYRQRAESNPQCAHPASG